MHVDKFIDMKLGQHNYARWMLNHFRLPAALRIDFEEFMKHHKLFCTYDGKRYRCTGASRMGDIWLAKDFHQTTGYDKRIDEIEECTDWSDEP